MVATLFVTPDHGALLHEVVNMPKDGDSEYRHDRTLRNRP